MAFIASHLNSKDEKKDLEKIFCAMETDQNCELSREEVLSGYEEHFGIPISEEAVYAMFKAVDIDGNDAIDYIEFVMATMNEKNLITNDKLRAAFRLFDKDGSGAIFSKEIKKTLGIKMRTKISYTSCSKKSMRTAMARFNLTNSAT